MPGSNKMSQTDGNEREQGLNKMWEMWRRASESRGKVS